MRFETVKGFCFTGKKYVGTVIIGRKKLKVEWRPERGQSVEEIKALMIAKAKEQIIDEATK